MLGAAEGYAMIMDRVSGMKAAIHVQVRKEEILKARWVVSSLSS